MYYQIQQRHHGQQHHYDDVIMTTLASQTTSLAIVYSTVYSDADQRKHQSSASLAFVWGIHRDRWIPRTMFPFDDVIMIVFYPCYILYSGAVCFVNNKWFSRLCVLHVLLVFRCLFCTYRCIFLRQQTSVKYKCHGGGGGGDSSPAFPPYPRPLFSLFYSCTPAQNSEFAPAPAPLTPTPAHFWSKSSIPRPPNPRATDPLSSPTNMDTELSDGFISTRQTIWVVRNMNHTSQWIYSQMPPNMKSFPPYVSPFSCLSVDLNCGHFYCHLPT